MISFGSPSDDVFRRKGFPLREFFPHRADVLRKLYPDTLLLLEGRGMKRAELQRCRFFQLNLYSSHVSGLPEELFFNRAINWHQQQLGQKGLIAAAGLCLQGRSLIVTVLQSDLCQQLFRHEDLKKSSKTQVEKRFGAWHRLLFNAILDFARRAGFAAVYCPTAAWILKATRRPVDPALFERIYDHAGKFYQARRVARGCAEYWEVDVGENAGRIVELRPSPSPSVTARKWICVFHDIEENVDTEISPQECRRNLSTMLEIERQAGVRATYDVLGALLPRKREEIEASGAHCLAFHSFNHRMEARQLPRCREIDLQIRGYRPPKSILTPELSDRTLAYYNFEWIANSGTFRWKSRRLENGIVKIPIRTDDYVLATGRMRYPQWRRALLNAFENRDLLAFGLHDCYARQWLDFYPELLQELGARGEFITADELCDITFLQQA